jgi:hypothetical protein
MLQVSRIAPWCRVLMSFVTGLRCVSLHTLCCDRWTEMRVKNSQNSLLHRYEQYAKVSKIIDALQSECAFLQPVEFIVAASKRLGIYGCDGIISLRNAAVEEKSAPFVALSFALQSLVSSIPDVRRVFAASDSQYSSSKVTCSANDDSCLKSLIAHLRAEQRKERVRLDGRIKAIVRYLRLLCIQMRCFGYSCRCPDSFLPITVSKVGSRHIGAIPPCQ